MNRGNVFTRVSSRKYPQPQHRAQYNEQRESRSSLSLFKTVTRNHDFKHKRQQIQNSTSSAAYDYTASLWVLLSESFETAMNKQPFLVLHQQDTAKPIEAGVNLFKEHCFAQT